MPRRDELRLDYAIEARDLTVRTCHLDPDFASLSLAAVAMDVEGCRWHEHRLTARVPESWRVHVPLPVVDDAWIAEDFDALVDSPVHAGPFDVERFDVDGHGHELLLIGTPPGGWPPSLTQDIASVCRATCRLMDTPPPAGDRYQLVIQMLENGYGGLEHDHSAVLQFNWPALARPGGLRQLLQLVGHEYLHQWNVRRLRPADYRPYDYGRPVVSEGLWFAEGITSYFDLTTTLLAGFSDRTQFLQDLGDELSRVLMTRTICAKPCRQCTRSLGQALQGNAFLEGYPGQLLPLWGRCRVLSRRGTEAGWQLTVCRSAGAMGEPWPLWTGISPSRHSLGHR